MIWHEIHEPSDPELDRLAAEYKLHPLHIEDCRHRGQNAKVEQQNDYLFVVLKSLALDEESDVDIGDFDIFIGPDYIITVQEGTCSAVNELIQRVRAVPDTMRPDQLFHRLMDWLVDSYGPVLDQLSDQIDKMEDRALTETSPEMLQTIFALKRALLQMRRVFANARDVTGHLLRNQFSQINADMMPFFRDVYDHLARDVDTVEVYRDLLNGATDLYLSSVANRTNQTMKVLTVFGTLATPAVVISGIYGMNVKHIPFADSPHSFTIVTALVLAVSIGMLLILRKFHWL